MWGARHKVPRRPLLQRVFQRLVPRRSMADKGGNRRDYTDPGFQESGYISPSSFGHVSAHKISPGDFTHSPVFAGVLENDTEHKNRMKQLEQARKLDPNKNNNKKSGAKVVNAAMLPAADYLSIPKYKRKLYESKRLVRKRIIKDYTRFDYAGNGLDEYTEWLAWKEAKRKRRAEVRENEERTKAEKEKEIGRDE